LISVPEPGNLTSYPPLGAAQEITLDQALGITVRHYTEAGKERQ